MTPAPADENLDPARELAAAVQRYRSDDNLGSLLDALRSLASRYAPDRLAAATAPYRDLPEVVIPVYEHIVSRTPEDAQALVVLANAYWLTGRGPDVVESLASWAIAADDGNRGAWHLWALAESDVRGRTERWQSVVRHFPSDHLARAALADNAASLAGAERDPLALDLAIATYEGLLAESSDSQQRRALQAAIETLRTWKL